MTEEPFEAERFVLTPAGHQALMSELRELQERYAAQMEEVRDVQNHTGGDSMPEEAAYFEAETMREHFEEHINRLTRILQHAEVLKEDPDPKRIDPGERVTLWDFSSKREMQLDLLSSPEAMARNEIGEGVKDVSTESPIGKALLGKQVGDIIEVEVPDGKVKYAIRRIEEIS